MQPPMYMPRMVLRCACTLPWRMYQMPRGRLTATKAVKKWIGVMPAMLGMR
jgi:hypothetical protein